MSDLLWVLEKYAADLQHTDRMAPESLKTYQTEALRIIAARAYSGSAFYRQKMDEAGVGLADLQELKTPASLPFLVKDELRGHPWRLLTCEKKDLALVQVSTDIHGGEEIYMGLSKRDCVVHEPAANYPALFPVGPGDVCLNALPYEMSAAGLGFHRFLVEARQATVIAAGRGGACSTPAKTLKVMRDLRPHLLVTSPFWAVTLAQEAARQDIDLPALGLRRLWLTGEGGSPALRARVETLWGCPALFFCGSLECGVMGIECEARDGYHLAQGHVLLELVDPRTEEPVAPGKVGELVVTTLLRYDSPLVRFRTGDLGILDDTPCRCGSTLGRFHPRGRAFEQLLESGSGVPIEPEFAWLAPDRAPGGPSAHGDTPAGPAR